MRRAIEIAMTHRMGANGTPSRCLRPKTVREIAQRVQRWAVASEVCQSCQNLPAVRFAELPLCSRCHQQRAILRGLRGEGEGLRPVVARAEDAASAEKRLEGYAIRFNEKSVELFGFYEFIRPAAADRLVAEKPDVRMLWNHSSNEPMGRYSAGTLRFEKRSRGVWIENDPPRSSENRVESIERRDVTGMSFGFIPLEDDWWLEDGMPHREILDMEVIEFSAVAFPAYPTTSISATAAGARSAMYRERQTAERLRMAR